MTDRWFAIVNPVAGKGRGLEDWPLITKLLRDNHIAFDFVFSERKYHAVELTVEAVNQGYRRIIVVGGDGTVHEVINGIFIQTQVPTGQVLVSVIAVGTGNDWVRMYGIPRKYSEAIKAIVRGHSFLQDVGDISFYKSSYHQHRYMANVAGIGFDAYVNRKYNQLKEEGKKGTMLYVFSTIKAIFGYRSRKVRIVVDGEEIFNGKLFSGAVGIGRYNGGGMRQTPEAIADDGLYDLTIIRSMSRLRVILHFMALYNGKIYKVPKVSLHRGRRISIQAMPESAIEIDGEAVGYSPFEFDIVDRAVRVVVGETFKAG